MRLDFIADIDGDGVYETIVGDNIAFAGGPVSFRIMIAGGPKRSGGATDVPLAILKRLHDKRMTFGDMLWMFFTMFQLSFDGNVQLVTVVADAEPVRGWLISGGTDEMLFEAFPCAAGPSYYRVELYGEVDMLGVINRVIYGNRRAMTNPIYFNY